MSIHGTYVGNNRVLIRLTAGGRLLISADDLSLMPELVSEGGYDIPFTAFLQRTLNPDAVFVDVGANVGLFTVIGARSAWQGQVIAYEPVPELLELLRANVQLNWLTDRVSVRGVAVAEGQDRRSFAFDSRLQMLGGLAHGEPTGSLVDVVCLDDELADLPRIDLVKIDVEGGEPAVIAGMAKLIRTGRVRQISCEVRTDAFQRRGLLMQWHALVQSLEQLEAQGWAFAIIEPDGGLTLRSVDQVIATEPHPNVVATTPHEWPER